jgi:hypothetical protein
MSGLNGLGWPNPENEPKPETMNTRRTLLKNLGAELCQMMTEDWRNEDERNILGMAGHWLRKLGNDDQLDQTILRLGETQERMIDAERQRDRLAEAVNAATVLIAAKGRHNTMLAYEGLRKALATSNQPNL